MYRKKNSSLFKHWDFVLLDLIMTELALFVAYFVKFEGAILFVTEAENYILYERIAMILVLIDLVVSMVASNSYKGILRRTKYQEIFSVFNRTVMVFAGTLLYMYLMRFSYSISRLLFGYYFVGLFVFVYVERLIWKRRIRRRVLSGEKKTSLYVVCEKATMDSAMRELAYNKYNDFRIDGVIVLDEDMRGQKVYGYPVVSASAGMMEFIRTNVVDEVYIDTNNMIISDQIAQEMIELGVTVHISLGHVGTMLPNRIVETYGKAMVLTGSMMVASNSQTIIKRIMDIVGSIVGLVLCLIAFIIFAPIIKFQSPGPIFFSQTRIGRNGRRFKIFKFRSMYTDAEARKKELIKENEMSGNMFKMENDPRVFPIGRFMRKYSIDELPQFLNILIGDMSLVGTRPPTEDEYENYAFHHKARLSIKPGLTGMWQVSGRSDITDFEEVVALDTEYIANWSLPLDIRILLKTIKVVLTAEGSK